MYCTGYYEQFQHSQNVVNGSNVFEESRDVNGSSITDKTGVLISFFAMNKDSVIQLVFWGSHYLRTVVRMCITQNNLDNREITSSGTADKKGVVISQQLLPGPWHRCGIVEKQSAVESLVFA